MTTPPPPSAHRHAGQLADLLADVIVKHAPFTSEVDARTRRKVTDEWLEGLEAHLQGAVGPILQELVDKTSPPPAVKAMLDGVIHPTAQFGTIAETLFTWGVAQAIISAMFTPFLQQLMNASSAAAVSDGIAKPLDPATIATAAARGLSPDNPPTFDVPKWAYDAAHENGVDDRDMNVMASIVGLPPALQELFELWRRGVITSDTLGEPPVHTGQPVATGTDGRPLTVEQGLREGDFRDDWIAAAVKLARTWLTPLDFVRAAVQEQLPYKDARAWADATGLDTSTQIPGLSTAEGATPDMFGLAYSIAGRPPGPVELGNMALRGIIPWKGTGADETTFQQGIAESDVKTKWTGALRKLMAYVPPPGTISSLLTRGAITEQQALSLFEQRGVPPEIAQAYVFTATQQAVEQHKLLAQGEIVTGYYDRILSREQALGMLEDLGYVGDVAADILDITDFRREIKAIDSVVRRVETLYGAFKLTETAALDALTTIGIAHDQAMALLDTWGALRTTPIRLPTARDIGRAWKAGTLTEEEAIQELGRLGYQPRDAAIVLSGEGAVAFSPLPPAGTSVTAAAGLKPIDVGPGGVSSTPGQGIRTES